MKEVSSKATAAFDTSRYYRWGWPVVKKVVPGKTTQKKVHEALDEAREEVVSQGHASPETFVTNWIMLTVQKLSKEGNPKSCLREHEAVKLFNTLLKDGGSLPIMWLKGAPGPLPDEWAEVQAACQAAYSGIPEPQRFRNYDN